MKHDVWKIVLTLIAQLSAIAGDTWIHVLAFGSLFYKGKKEFFLRFRFLYDLVNLQITHTKKDYYQHTEILLQQCIVSMWHSLGF